MLRVLLLTGIIASVPPVFGQTLSPSAAPARSGAAPTTHERSEAGMAAFQAAPSLEQRVADLEAYITNSPRGTDVSLAGSSNIAAAGPSYNAWMMTCAALVL